MDFFNYNLINEKDEEDGQFPIPIIRTIFLLSGNGNSFKQHTYYRLVVYIWDVDYYTLGANCKEAYILQACS